MSSASNSSPEDLNNHDAFGGSSNKRRRNSTHDDESLPSRVDEARGEHGEPPKSKRIACIICRKRKLKCDGTKPSCSTCTRLGHNCAYDEVRRKSGPKRGYVKALEERLKQVETMLKTQEPAIVSAPEASVTSFVVTNNGQNGNPVAMSNLDMNGINGNVGYETSRDQDAWGLPTDSPQQPPMDDMTFSNTLGMGISMGEANFTWEMIGLGLDEPLPPQETVDDLHQIFFEKVHPSLPMIHKFRYLAAMNLAPNQRPPVCLRYAMWTLACSVADKYSSLKEHFYQRARKYVEQDYLKGHGEHMISVAHAQTHILLASYEFKMMFFPRAWMSTGSAVRLCQMMGLHRLDGAGLDVKQCLPGPRDWTEREERRRTFWMAFCEDRYASIGTGWPMTIDETDILTNLPASEEAFEKSKEARTQTLGEALQTTGASTLSPFAGVVLMACLFGRNLIHLHRPDADDRDNDLNGEFWKRHRNMDNILLNTSLNLPEHLKLPTGLASPNNVFTNMNIHTSTICLHQAAIYKADKNRLPASVSKESKLRCITAANEIASIMRMISHLDLSGMNPFISFCLYVAARVFVQYLKSRPDDSSTADSLKFLLTAMNAMKSKNPLTESFLVQLDVDLESLGLRNPKYKYFTQSARAVNLNGNTPATYGNKLNTSSFSRGPNGKVDHCNFLKIVDDVSPVDTEPTIPGAMPSGFNQTTSPDVNSNPSDSVPSFDFSGQDMSWFPSSTELTGNTGMEEASLQGILPGQGKGRIYETVRNVHGHVSGYGTTENASVSAAMEMDFSDQGQSSDRPTPASSISALSDGHLRANNGRRSGNSSFSTSPAVSNANNSGHGMFAADHSDFMGGSNGGASTGMTPGSNGAFAMPDTPGRGFGVPSGWELTGQGLTPVGEGVFQALMEVAPMEMGWNFGEGSK